MARMPPPSTALTTLKYRLPPIPSIRDILRLYRLTAQKRLSQNFLLNGGIVDSMVRRAGNLNDAYVVEVGPGPGSITRSILKHEPKQVTVIEKDERFVPILEHLMDAVNGHVRMRIEVADIFHYNLANAFRSAPIYDWHDDPPPIYIIGNLPFNVATPLIIRWYKMISTKESIWSNGRVQMMLTFQKEVAQRIVAPVMGENRCRLSVMSQLWCEPHFHFSIPGKCFNPQPDVDVGVVSVTPRRRPLTNLPFELVEKVVRQVFNARRKRAIESAQTLFTERTRHQLSRELFHVAEVDPRLRPYELTNDDFVRLAMSYRLICDDHRNMEKYDIWSPRRTREDLDSYD